MKTYMMFICLLVLFSFNAAQAKIVSNSSSSLDHDLNYKFDDQEDSKRNIASEEDLDKQELEEDSERDVASDAEENSNNIQYWKY